MSSRFEKLFMVAEMSCNHGGSLERACKIIEQAASHDANAVKIQVYSPDEMTLPTAKVQIKSGLWAEKNLYSIYQDAQTPVEWLPTLFKCAEDHKILLFASPFSSNGVAMLEKFNCPIYKIASFEITHLPLIKAAALTKKPLIISTGMSNTNDIDDAVMTARLNGNPELALLKCVSEYPANPKNFNLATIPEMKHRWQTHVGLSDHSTHVGISAAAVAFGATIIEKHFTLDDGLVTLDSEFSLTPKQFQDLRIQCAAAKAAVGQIKFGATLGEETNLRRTIYAIKDIEQGERFSSENIAVLRPFSNSGIHPKFYESMIQTDTAKNRIYAGNTVSWEDVK